MIIVEKLSTASDLSECALEQAIKQLQARLGEANVTAIELRVPIAQRFAAERLLKALDVKGANRTIFHLLVSSARVYADFYAKNNWEVRCSNVIILSEIDQ